MSVYPDHMHAPALDAPVVHLARPHRPVLVAGTLRELAGPTGGPGRAAAAAVVGPAARVRPGQPTMLAWMYENVLREAIRVERAAGLPARAHPGPGVAAAESAPRRARRLGGPAPALRPPVTDPSTGTSPGSRSRSPPNTASSSAAASPGWSTAWSTGPPRTSTCSPTPPAGCAAAAGEVDRGADRGRLPGGPRGRRRTVRRHGRRHPGVPGRRAGPGAAADPVPPRPAPGAGGDGRRAGHAPRRPGRHQGRGAGRTGARCATTSTSPPRWSAIPLPRVLELAARRRPRHRPGRTSPTPAATWTGSTTPGSPLYGLGNAEITELRHRSANWPRRRPGAAFSIDWLDHADRPPARVTADPDAVFDAFRPGPASRASTLYPHQEEALHRARHRGERDPQHADRLRQEPGRDRRALRRPGRAAAPPSTPRRSRRWCRRSSSPCARSSAPSNVGMLTGDAASTPTRRSSAAPPRSWPTSRCARARTPTSARS